LIPAIFLALLAQGELDDSSRIMRILRALTQHLQLSFLAQSAPQVAISPVSNMAIAATKPNIVVIGGSFGGYYAVVAIAEAMHKTHNTILIEKNSHNQVHFGS
jgi:predicted esterase YcpF (UPF0227 family)